MGSPVTVTVTRSVLLRLLVVVSAPAAASASLTSLTACDDGPSNDPGGAGGSTTGAGGSGGSYAAGAGTGGTAAELPPIPQGSAGSTTGYPECGPDMTSPSGFGFHGSCCIDVECRAPTAAGSCPDPSAVQRGSGSGSCGCGTTEGPFAPGEAQAAAVAEGKTCCYLAGIIGCDGRPLLVEGIARVASLAANAGGWAS